MLITYFSLVCILGTAMAQDGYSRDNPSNQLGYNPFGQQIVDDEYDVVNGDEIPGEAGRDYPVYAEVPPTRFRCSAQRTRGYYADPQTQCQAFWICQDDGRSDAFLCPNGTIFNQRYLVCDWWYNFDCATALSLYSVNDEVAAAQDEVDRRAALLRLSQLRSSAYASSSPYSSTGGYDYSSASGAPSSPYSSSNGYNNPASSYTGSSAYRRPYSPLRSPLKRLGSNRRISSARLNAPSSSYGAPSSGRYNNAQSNRGNLNNAASSYNAPSSSGRFNAPSTSYGAPSSNNQQQSNEYNGGSNGRDSSPSTSYGTPFSNNQQQSNGYNGGSNGRFSSPSTSYGTPFTNNQQQSNGYSGGSNGRFNSPSTSYGTPFSGDNSRFRNANNRNSGSSQSLDSGYDSGIPTTGNNFSDEVDSFDDVANPDRSYLPPSNNAAQISAPDRSYLPPSK